MKGFTHFVDFYVLIPCYNDVEGLVRALQSIHYHPSKFAVLIVDDGSQTPVTHASIQPHIPAALSVDIITLPENMGITKALNAGLQWLHDRGGFEYVARLDCGDICDANRFYSQVSFMQQHPDTAMIGSWCVFTDFTTGSSYQYTTPTLHRQIAKGMHFRNIFIHPTVMWRASAMEKTGFYPETFPHAEDYGFFYHVMSQGKCAVLPEKLVTCKINPAGISLQHRKAQLKSRMKVVRHYGENKMLAILGIMKLWLLMMVPYPLVLQAKKMLHGV